MQLNNQGVSSLTQRFFSHQVPIVLLCQQLGQVVERVVTGARRAWTAQWVGQRGSSVGLTRPGWRLVCKVTDGGKNRWRLARPDTILICSLGGRPPAPRLPLLPTLLHRHPHPHCHRHRHLDHHHHRHRRLCAH